MSYRLVPRLHPQAQLPALAHDTARDGAACGVLRVRLSVVSPEGLHAGTGRQVLRDGALVSLASRCADRPSLPGSGLKGAVRTVFEVLTGSCAITDPKDRCSANAPCPACSVFGHLGHAGHIGFSEFVADRAQFDVTQTAEGWGGKSRSPDYRFYDGRRPFDREGNMLPRTNPTEVLPTATRLHGSVWFRHVPLAHLGMLWLSLGLGTGERQVPLRAGGRKFDGLGLLEPTPEGLSLGEAGRIGRAARRHPVTDPRPWIDTCIDAALEVSPATADVIASVRSI